MSADEVFSCRKSALPARRRQDRLRGLVLGDRAARLELPDPSRHQPPNESSPALIATWPSMARRASPSTSPPSATSSTSRRRASTAWTGRPGSDDTGRSTPATTPPRAGSTRSTTSAPNTSTGASLRSRRSGRPAGRPKASRASSPTGSHLTAGASDGSASSPLRYRDRVELQSIGDEGERRSHLPRAGMAIASQSDPSRRRYSEKRRRSQSASKGSTITVWPSASRTWP